MKTCRNGHSYTGDENQRARSGRCPVCFRLVQTRYNRSEKGRAVQARYDGSLKGEARRVRFKQSPAGWLHALQTRRACALRRRANRVIHEEAEDPSGTLPS